MLMKHSDVIRTMRPYQRRLAVMLIDDVENGIFPNSIEEVVSLYGERMGESFHFETRKGWKGEIRHAAAITLFRYGLAKGKVVALGDDEALSSWSRNRMELEAAAAIETEFGGNRALSEKAKDIVRDTKILGRGSRAIYLYTDSILDSLGCSFTKIGRHHLSGSGEVLRRILSQYSTGNPGFPVLRVIALTDSDVSLETHLHRKFKQHRVSGGFGTEWFSVSYKEVRDEIENHL